MSRFSGEAYSKLFPKQVEKPTIETQVEAFTPTSDNIENIENSIDNIEMQEGETNVTDN